MSRLEQAAINLHKVLWHNTGDTEDWPIMLKVDEEIHDELIAALNELFNAVEKIDVSLVPWPLDNPL